MNTVYIKNYSEPQFNTKEVLRYSGADIHSSEMAEYAQRCMEEIKNKLIYKVCYCETDIKVSGNTVDFGYISTQSKNLSYTLKECKKAIIFCATVGIGIDREIAACMKRDAAKGFMFQAIGTERCESLCNEFVKDIKNEHMPEGIYLTPRFSPGYGDLSLDFQKDIFSLLDLPRKIGVTLNESLIISPSKSVTAIFGLSRKDCGYSENKCKGCNMKECTFRQ